MRVTLNGKPTELKPAVEKRLAKKNGPAVVEGVVLTAAEAAQVAARTLQLVYTTALVVAAVLVVGVVIGAASYEPEDLVVVVPVVVVLGAAVALFARFIYRRRMTRAQRRAEEQAPRMPPPGAAVRVDAEGLTVGGTRTPWSSLTIDEVDITESSSEDTQVAWIESLALSAGGRPILLDILLLKNGRMVVDAVWRALRPAP